MYFAIFTAVRRYESINLMTLLALLGAVTLPSSVHAADVFLCITTAQELQDGLTSASDGGAHANDVVILQIAKGTYKVGAATGNGPFHYSSSNAGILTKILGGFNADCTTQEQTPIHTILDGNHAAQVIRLESTGTESEVQLGLVTVRNGQTTQPGGGVSFNAASEGAGTVALFDDIIENNTTTNEGGGVYLVNSTTSQGVALLGSLLMGNSASSSGAGVVAAYPDGVGITQIKSNTIYGNTATNSGDVGGLTFRGDSTGAIYANIFWNNSNTGLYLDGPSAQVQYNDYGTLGGDAPGNSVSNVSVNPQFVDENGGDFHLSQASTLFGLAKECYPGLDLDGNSRNATCVSDPGAYEDTIFGNGLEGN